MEEVDEVTRLIATIYSMIKLEAGNISLKPCQRSEPAKNLELVFQQIFADASSHDLLDVFLILSELSRTRYEPIVVLDEVIKEVVRKQDVEKNKRNGSVGKFNYDRFGR